MNRAGYYNTFKVQTLKGTFYFTSNEDIEQFFCCSSDRVNQTNPIGIEYGLILTPYVNLNRRGYNYYKI